MRESFYRDRASSIFGYWLKGGRDGSEEVWRKATEAARKGIITSDEAMQLREADLLWLGTIRWGRYAEQEVVLVGEISWTVSQWDVERALERAAIARKADLWAVPFVGGKQWDEPLKQTALAQGVICAEDGRIEPDHWDELLARWKLTTP